MKNKTMQVKRSIQQVEHIDVDSITFMSDDEILDRLRMLEAERNKAINLHVSPTAWEVEICYLKREYDMRFSRHEKHLKYMHEVDLENKTVFVDERTLPTGDFDNIEYVSLFDEYHLN